MADVLAVRNEFRLQNWMEIIRECEESGLSNREFCFQRGISEKRWKGCRSSSRRRYEK